MIQDRAAHKLSQTLGQKIDYRRPHPYSTLPGGYVIVGTGEYLGETSAEARKAVLRRTA